MNKRVYQHPTMIVVKIQRRCLLSGSVTDASGPLNYGGAGGDREANSRGFSNWDDDCDE